MVAVTMMHVSMLRGCEDDDGGGVSVWVVHVVQVLFLVHTKC